MNPELLEFSLSDSSFFDSCCYICRESIHDIGINLLDARTTYMGLSLPDKLGQVIGNKYIIVVSKEDKVCLPCHNLVNRLDELEFNVSNIKQRIIQLLEFTHNLHSLVDNDLSSPKSDSVNEQYLETYVSSSSLKNSFADFCITDVHSTELSDNEINANNFYIQKKADDLPLKINAVLWKQSKKNSLSVPDLTNQNAINYPNRNSEVNVFEQIIENGINESNVKFKDDLSNDNHDFNSFYVQGTRSNLLLDGKPESEVSFHVKEEQENVDYFPELLLPLKESSKSIFSNNKKDMPIVSTEHDITLSKENFQRTVKEKIFTCTICDVPFPKSYLLSRHTRIHQKSLKKVTCSICNFECHDHLHYLYHRKNEHDLLKRISCPLCNKNFCFNRELRNHVLTAHEGEIFNCNECGETFKRFIQFENHKLYSHGNKHCRICGKHISSVVKLRQHENRHVWIDSKKLSCDVCGRCFKTPGGLRIHKVSHTGNYKFFCEFCGKGFMSSVILEEHKGVHTKEERYICDMCGRKFVLYSTFHLHKQWHEDPFPFPCYICKKKFRYRSVRSIHIRRDHTGENPYKCHYCNAEFLKSVSLKKHICTHTKKYPFNCNNCQKGFDERRSLARHLARIHNDKSLQNEKPKKCQYKVILRPDEFPIIS